MPNKLPQETQGGIWGVLGGQTFKSKGKLSNRWTLVHVRGFIWEWASRRPSIHKGACRVGGWVIGHKFKSFGKLS